MIRKSILILLFFIFMTGSGKGQVRSNGPAPILFHGVVMDATTQSKLTGTEVIINRIHATSSSDDGAFSFYAFKMDTIVFTMLGYKPMAVIISDTLSGRDFLTGVYLETDTVLIGEVIIIPKISSLKGEIMNPQLRSDTKMENAATNVSTAAYVGRTTPSKLGDPASNYDYLRQKSKIDAFEKGGIPSDRILGVNPFILLPAAYLLLHGRPETPPAPKPQISTKDMEEIKKRYQEIIKNRNKN
jgi:hypothetical protein